MIKININGNRSDIAGYVSYYSCEELAELLGIDQDEIIYETTIVDYFLHGDITFDSEIIVNVTLTDNYIDHINEITNIIVKYVSFFTDKCQVYFDVIDSRLVYIYENKNKKKVEANKYSEENHECSCEHHDHHNHNCEHHHDHEHGCNHHHDHDCCCGHKHDTDEE